MRKVGKGGIVCSFLQIFLPLHHSRFSPPLSPDPRPCSCSSRDVGKPNDVCACSHMCQMFTHTRTLLAKYSKVPCTPRVTIGTYPSAPRLTYPVIV